MRFVKHSLTNRLVYLRMLVLLGSILILAGGLFIKSSTDSFLDPWFLRLIISINGIIIVAISFVSKKVERNFQYWVYLLVVICTLWIVYLSIINHFHPRYILTIVILFPGFSLVMQSRRHLNYYTALFVIVTIGASLVVESPIYPVQAFITQLIIIVIIISISVSSFLQAHSELSFSSENLKALVDNTDESYIMLNPDYTIKMVNRSASENLTQILNTELNQGDDFRKFVHQSEIVIFEKNFSKALNGHKVDVEREVKLSEKTTVWLEIKYIPVVDRNGETINVLFTARNITGKKTAEDEMKNKNLELEKINAELDRFVYRAAHDLRAPLSSVLGLINLIEMEKEKAKVGDYLAMMKQSVDRLNGFIDGVIEHSMNARTGLLIEKISFRKILDNVFENHSFMKGADRISKRITVNGNHDFYSDPGRMEIIFNNLLSNSIKYQDDQKTEPTVEVKVEINEESAEVLVEDNGLGIPKDNLDKIFDIFYRGR